VPAIGEALNRLETRYGRRPEFSLPYFPTAFLNLFYCAGLANGSTPRRDSQLPRQLMKAFNAQRIDRLLRDGFVRLAVMNGSPVLDSPHREGAGKIQVSFAGELSAIISAHAEARSWILHRIRNGFHGPYNTQDGAFLVHTTYVADLAEPSGWRPSEYLHILYKLKPSKVALAKLDMFGHFSASLAELSEASRAVVADGADGLRYLTHRTLAPFREVLTDEIMEVVPQVNRMSRAERSAGLGARFLDGCLTALGVRDSQRLIEVTSFPREFQSYPPWNGSRAEFLAMLGRGSAQR